MEEAVLLPFHKEWLDMIATGKKKFEFRNKIGKDYKEGMKVYLYITKHNGGSGMIEAEFTIGEILIFNYDMAQIRIIGKVDKIKEIQKTDLSSIGFNGQKYAIEIKDFKKYDNPIPKEELINWNKAKVLYKAYGISLIENIDFVFQDCFIKSPPQSMIYVVEREEL